MKRGVYERGSLSRRRFLRLSALGLFSGVAITVSGCGRDHSSATTTQGTGETGAVAGNHGHRAFVSDAQLAANRSLTVSIRGTADHDHTITLSAPELASILSGTRVAKNSATTNGHRHTITFN